MATLKKSARKRTSGKQDTPQSQAERLSKTLGESAQQVWLAGVGAFGRAQAEGSKLFETLVKEGLSLEQTTRKVASHRVDAVRDAVESTVGQARERATDTWDRLEKVFEQRVQQALRRLEVPSREDLAALVERVDTLNAQLRKLNAAPAPRKAAQKSPAKATAKPKAKPVAKVAKKPATPRKRAPRKTAG